MYDYTHIYIKLIHILKENVITSLSKFIID
jgi:hypothetical protein